MAFTRVTRLEAAMAPPKKYEHIDFQPPEAVANAAAKGLEYRQKASPSNRGGLTQSEAAKEGIGSGVQRAVNLKNRDTISPDTVRQMGAFFSRHEKNKAVSAENKQEPWNDKGYVAWLLWGGDPGQRWVGKVMKQMDKADASKTAALEDACWEGYEAVGMKEQGGKQVPNCVPKSARTADMDGNYMSVKAIRALQDHASMLMEHITEDVVLPDWVEAKITRANSDLTDVFEHFQHQGRNASLRAKVIRLASTNPALRPHLLPLLQKR